jgi:hypothetical protein
MSFKGATHEILLMPRQTMINNPATVVMALVSGLTRQPVPSRALCWLLALIRQDRRKLKPRSQNTQRGDGSHRAAGSAR